MPTFPGRAGEVVEIGSCERDVVAKTFDTSVRVFEAEWIAFARTRNAREVERGVVGREKGDLPSAPPKPAAIRDRLIFTVTGEEKAVILAAVLVL